VARLILPAGLTALVLCVSVQSAWAAGPTVDTGAASQVTYSSATLNGTLDPNGQSTTYYFQYGPTKAYGQQTLIGGVAAGQSPVHVSAQITGLQPAAVYHYRLVALNSAGAQSGKDRTFTTLKVPLSLAILGAPNPVPYGTAVTIEGTLSGTGNGQREVILQSNPFPYTQGFLNVGNPELTSSSGSFSFPVLGLTEATQFRVLTTTKSVVVSPVLTEGVAVRVSVHYRHTRRRHRVRIYGTVVPSEPGMQVGIFRVRRGHTRLIAGTILHAKGLTSSAYSRVVRVVRGGVYIVLARVTDGSHTSAYSTPIRIR
jgi:hypothetical protein